MCIKPNFVWIPDGNTYKKQEVACNHCWACLLNQENDLIGRCLCEASFARWVHTLTLTYDDKRLPERSTRTSIVHKSDFQNFMKGLRNEYPCRYLVAGEYGDKKGRAHFHAILFGLSDAEPPASHFQEMKYYPFWDWGFTYSENTPASYRAVKYISKYLTKKKRTKRDDTISDEWISYSRKPLMGAPFILELAERQAEMRVPPYTLNYMPPGQGNNKLKFSLYGRAQNIYFDALLANWPDFHNARKTEWVERAYKRHLNYLHLKNWEKLPVAEQGEAIAANIRHTSKVLTDAEKLRNGYRNFDIKKRLRDGWQEADEAVKAQVRATQEQSVTYLTDKYGPIISRT